MYSKSQPIIVIKRKSGGGGHHGGAWKVAYADFVTALMSLFIVLWLMGSSEKVKKAVAGYFNDPQGTGSLMGTTMTGTGETITAAAGDNMQQLKDKLEQEIKAQTELEKLSKQIEITITSEGLRIELLEDKKGTFYQSGSARLSESGQQLLALLAAELKTLPNHLLIEGHTDATGPADHNLVLSRDRAQSVAGYLALQNVSPPRFSTMGYGAAQPVATNDSAEGRQANRRVDIAVMANEKLKKAAQDQARKDGQ
jgi:chemotaxis protein MotB